MVVAGDFQHMDRCLGIYVAEGNCAGICRHYRRRYVPGRDAAEQAIRHRAILTSGLPARSCTYMVAMLRTRAAAPLVPGPCHKLAFRCSGTGPAHVLAHGLWVWGEWKQLGRRIVATFANERESTFGRSCASN